MSAIFISHAKENIEQTQSLKARLESWNHHSLFIDFDPEAGIKAGRSWERTLYRKLRACRAVVAWITDDYVTSYWCFAEIALARMEGKPIFAMLDPSLSPDAVLPSILAEKQYIDLRIDQENGFLRLKNGLKELDIIGTSGDWDPKDPPYLGLSYYDEKHAPVFFGREDETRAGIELINRGAPNLIMVLGASGSGKSSLARAGILPRLRQDPDQFLVVEPFRPRQDPFRELADVLDRAQRRFAPAGATSLASDEEIRNRLLAWRAQNMPNTPAGESNPETAPASLPSEDAELHASESQSEERLHALLAKIEDLKGELPRSPETSSFTFLDWTVDDLRRITRETEETGQSSHTPLVDLADQLQRTSERRNGRIILVIDQFEELLGYESEGAEHPANRFLELLRTTLDGENCPVLVIGTMRSDFLGTFQRNPALRGIDFESLSLGPMKLEGMRKVIEEPAKLGALELENGLADRLLADTETPDALPLLSFTLWVMWRDYREDGKLSVSDYEELGGLDGAIAREADALLRSAETDGKTDLLRKAFVRMARLSDGGNYARQPVNWDDEALHPVHDVLNHFVDRRLLVKMVDEEETMVEVAHEALFRSWTPLKTWLDENRADLLLRQQIERDAKAWENEAKPADRLWHGSRLQQAQDLRRREALPRTEDQFLAAGLRRRRRHRITLVSLTTSVFLVLAGFLVFALEQKKVAQENALEAEHQKKEANRQTANAFWQVGTIARAKGAGVKAAHHFLAAAKASDAAADQTQRHNFELAAHFASAGQICTFLHDQSVFGAVFTADETRVLSWSEDGAVKLWEVTKAEALQQWKHDGSVFGAVFTADESRVLSWSGDYGKGAVKLWDVTKSEALQEWKHDNYVNGAVFTADETRVLSWSGCIVGGAGAVKLWDVTKAEALQEWKHDERVKGAVFTADETRVLSWSGGDYGKGAVKLWDVTKAEALQEWKHDEAVNGAAFTADESRVLSWGAGVAVKLWDVTKGELLQEWKHDWGRGDVFTADESRVLSWSEVGTVKLWDVTKGKALQEWKHDGGVNGAVFTADESRVLSWSVDGAVKLWDVTKAEALQEWKHDESVWGAVFGKLSVSHYEELGGLDGAIAREADALLRSAETEGKTDLLRKAFVRMARLSDGGNYARQPVNADESRVLSWSIDGAVKLWDVTKAEALQEWKHDGKVYGAAFTTDESRVLSWSGGVLSSGAVKLWDLTKAEALQEWKHDESVRGAVFSADESRVLSWGAGVAVKLWDVTKAEALQEWEHDEPVNGAVFTADESRVLSWSNDGAVKLWDVTKGELLQQWKHDGKVYGAAFSTDESRVLSWSNDGAVKLWDVTKGEALQEWKHDEFIWGAAFTADESRVLSWSGDYGKGAVKLWDVTKAEALQEWKHGGYVKEAVFTADESRVLSWSNDGAVKLWDVTKGELLQEWEHREPVIGAVFTADESRVLSWSGEYLGGGAVKLWDVTKAEALQEWKHDEEVKGVVFTADESRFLSWSGDDSRDGTVRLWDVTKAEALQEWKHEEYVNGAVFTNDETRILSWSVDGAVKLWDVTKAEMLQEWEHDESVHGAVFTADETRVLSWSGSILGGAGAVTLWDVTKAEPLQEWKHDEYVNGAVFTNDESRVLSWSDDGAVKLWDTALRDPTLTPAERILELEVRSAMRLNSAGQVVPLRSNEWNKKVRSPEYAALQKKMKKSDPRRAHSNPANLRMTEEEEQKAEIKKTLQKAPANPKAKSEAKTEAPEAAPPTSPAPKPPATEPSVEPGPPAQ